MWYCCLALLDHCKVNKNKPYTIPWFWLFGQDVALVGFLLTLPLPLSWVVWPARYEGVYDGFTNVTVLLPDIFLALWLLLSLRKDTWLKVAFPQIIWPMLMLVGLTTVSAFWAEHPFLALKQSGHLLWGLLLCWRVLHMRPVAWQIAQLALLLSLLGQTAVAIAQFLTQNDLGLRFLGELDLMSQAGESILFAHGQYWLRAYGLTPHPNILGGVLAVFVLLLIPAYLHAPSKKSWGWLGLLLLGLCGLFFSFSRAAWLGGVVGGLFFVGMLLLTGESSLRARRVLILGLASLLVLGILGWQHQALLFSRVTPASNALESRAVDERVLLAELGLALWRESPVVGIGAGQTAVAMTPLVREIPKIGPQPIHNVLLLLLVELGVAGVLLWGWLTIYPIGWAIIHRRQLSIWLLGCTSALVALAVIGLFDYYSWGWQQGRLLHWLCWGLWSWQATNIKNG